MEAGSWFTLHGHEGGNSGYRQGWKLQATAPALDPTEAQNRTLRLPCEEHHPAWTEPETSRNMTQYTEPLQTQPSDTNVPVFRSSIPRSGTVRERLFPAVAALLVLCSVTSCRNNEVGSETGLDSGRDAVGGIDVRVGDGEDDAPRLSDFGEDVPGVELPGTVTTVGVVPTVTGGTAASSTYVTRFALTVPVAASSASSESYKTSGQLTISPHPRTTEDDTENDE